MKYMHDSPSGAIFSLDRDYRYSLWRRWDDGPFAAFCCLNPSTADDVNNDPTVSRCVNFSKRWGYSAFVMLNIFAYRATDPKTMKSQDDPIGPENDAAIRELSSKAGLVVCAWGTHGSHMNRCNDVKSLLIDSTGNNIWHLGLTKHGFCKHPLYLRCDTQPVRWK